MDIEHASGERAEADARVVARARRAGGRTFLVASGLLVPLGVMAGGDGAAVLIWVLSALVLALLVNAGWLILAVLLDLRAGVFPGRRRVAITVLSFAAAFVSPILPLAAAAAAGGG